MVEFLNWCKWTIVDMVWPTIGRLEKSLLALLNWYCFPAGTDKRLRLSWRERKMSAQKSNGLFYMSILLAWVQNHFSSTSNLSKIKTYMCRWPQICPCRRTWAWACERDDALKPLRYDSAVPWNLVLGIFVNIRRRKPSNAGFQNPPRNLPTHCFCVCTGAMINQAGSVGSVSDTTLGWSS